MNTNQSEYPFYLRLWSVLAHAVTACAIVVNLLTAISSALTRAVNATRSWVGVGPLSLSGQPYRFSRTALEVRFAAFCAGNGIWMMTIFL